MKKIKLVIVIILSVVVLAGCSSSEDLSDNSSEKPGSLVVKMELPDEISSAAVSSQGVEDYLELKRITVKVYQGAEISDSSLFKSKEISNLSGNLETAFDKIEVGYKYTVVVEGYGILDGESEDEKIYQGKSVSDKVLSEEAITTVNVIVDRTNAKSVEVNMNNIADGYEINNITLRHLSSQEEVTKDYSGNSIVFSNGDSLDSGQGTLTLVSSIWYIDLNLSNGNTISYEILLLPAQSKKVNLDLINDNGNLTITTSFIESPTAPSNLQINASGNLTWDYQENIKLYSIYKSDNLDGTKELIDSVQTNEYSSPTPGNYYWIRAYNNDDYSSDLSNGIYINSDGTGDNTDNNVIDDGEEIIASFNDQALEFTVRDKLNQPEGDILVSDLESILTLYVDYIHNDSETSSLAGIDKLKNLEEFSYYFSNGSAYSEEYGLTDVSTLSSLTKLKELNLSGNSFTDISNLSTLINLETLMLTDNEIEDINVVNHFDDLRYLSAGGNNIQRVEIFDLPYLSRIGLSGNIIETLILNNLDQLSDLTISSNPIKKLELVNLPNLRDLYIYNVEDVTLDNLNSLKELNFSSNNLINVDITNMNGLETLYVGNNDNLEYINLNNLDNLMTLEAASIKVSDISFLNGLSSLETLNLSNNEITDIIPLSNLINLEKLNLRANNINDISDLSNLSNLRILDLYSNNISDIDVLLGLNNLEEVDLYFNNLDENSGSDAMNVISQLEQRGVEVNY